VRVLALAGAVLALGGSSVVGTVATGGNPCGVAGAAGFVWVTDAASAELLKIDPLDGSAFAVRDPDGAERVREVVGGEVWVPNDGNATLSRLSSAGKLLETVKTSGNPAVVAGIGGDVWASIFDAGEVWQIRPS